MREGALVKYQIFIYIHKAPCLSVRLCVRPLRAKGAKLSPLQVLEFWARRALKF